jgi:hypothetical protein
MNIDARELICLEVETVRLPLICSGAALTKEDIIVK